MKAPACVAMVLLASPGIARADEPPKEKVRWSDRPLEPVEQVEAPEPPPPRPFSAKVGIGFTYRNLYTVPIRAAALDVALGRRLHRHVALYGTAEGLLGATEVGLFVRQVALGVSCEGIVERFRIGAGFRYALLFVDRVTEGDDLVDAGPGGALFVTYDLLGPPEHPMYAGLEATADTLGKESGSGGTSPLMVGGTLLVGLRY